MPSGNIRQQDYFGVKTSCNRLNRVSRSKRNRFCGIKNASGCNYAALARVGRTPRLTKQKPEPGGGTAFETVDRREFLTLAGGSLPPKTVLCFCYRHDLNIPRNTHTHTRIGLKNPFRFKHCRGSTVFFPGNARPLLKGIRPCKQNHASLIINSPAGEFSRRWRQRVMSCCRVRSRARRCRLSFGGVHHEHWNFDT